jgi:hypothetical protein
VRRWVFAVSADIAAWRLQLEEHHPPEQCAETIAFARLWSLPLQSRSTQFVSRLAFFQRMPFEAWGFLSRFAADHVRAANGGPHQILEFTATLSGLQTYH